MVHKKLSVKGWVVNPRNQDLQYTHFAIIICISFTDYLMGPCIATHPHDKCISPK